MAARKWTPEQRERQAGLIRNWRPWLASTGPSTKEGKSRVANNAFKGGKRPKLRELYRALSELLFEAHEKLEVIENACNSTFHYKDLATCKHTTNPSRTELASKPTSKLG